MLTPAEIEAVRLWLLDGREIIEGRISSGIIDDNTMILRIDKGIVADIVQAGVVVWPGLSKPDDAMIAILQDIIGDREPLADKPRNWSGGALLCGPMAIMAWRATQNLTTVVKD